MTLRLRQCLESSCLDTTDGMEAVGTCAKDYFQHWEQAIRKKGEKGGASSLRLEAAVKT